MTSFSIKPLCISLITVFAIDEPTIDYIIKVVIGLLTISYYVRNLFFDKRRKK